MRFHKVLSAISFADLRIYFSTLWNSYVDMADYLMKSEVNRKTKMAVMIMT